jgi:hypothetical protein
MLHTLSHSDRHSESMHSPESPEMEKSLARRQPQTIKNTLYAEDGTSSWYISWNQSGSFQREPNPRSLAEQKRAIGVKISSSFARTLDAERESPTSLNIRVLQVPTSR